MADNSIKISIRADSAEAQSNLAKLAQEFKKMSDGFTKPIGEIAAFAKLKKSLSENEKAFKEAQARVRELAQEIKGSSEPSKQLSADFEKAKNHARALSDAITRQNVQLHTLRESMRNSGVDTTKLASEQLRLKNALKDVNAAFQQSKNVSLARDALGIRPHQELRSEIEKLKNSYKTLAQSGTLSMSELAQAKVKLADKIRDLKAQQNGWIEGLEKAKGAIASFATGMAAIVFPVKAAMEFESAMSGVAKVVDAPENEIRQLSETLLLLTRTMPFTAVELANIAEAGGQMGIASKDIAAFVEQTAKIGTAFNMSADEAGRAIGKLMNIFHLSVSQVGSLADTINVLGNNTNAVERDITDVLIRVGGMSQTFGLTTKETAALATAFLSLGRPVEVSATAIQAMLSKLQAANVGTVEFRGALDAMGVDAEKLAKAIRDKPQEALLGFLELLKSLDKQTRAERLVKLFGLEHQDDISILLEGLDQYKAALGMVADETLAAGAVNKEYERGMLTLEKRLGLLKNAFVEIQTRLGNNDLPYIKSLIGGLTQLLNVISDFIKAQPEFSGALLAIGALFASLGALKLAWGAVLLLFGQGAGFISGLIVSFKEIAFGVELLVARFVTLSSTLSTVIGVIGTLGLAFAAFWGASKILDLISVLKDFFDLEADQGKVIHALQQKMDKYKEYRDFTARTLNELKLMDEDQLRNEYENLQKTIKYLSQRKELLQQQFNMNYKDKTPENISLEFGGIDTVDMREDQEALDALQTKLDSAMEAMRKLGVAAKANGIDLSKQTNALEETGAAADKAAVDFKKLRASEGQAKNSVDALKKSHDQLNQSLSQSYDFAAEEARALAKSEKEGVLASLDIYRQKKDMLIGLATDTSRKQLESLNAAKMDEVAYNEEVQKIAQATTEVKKKAIEEWMGKLKESYFAALSEEQKWAEAVKKTQAEIVSSRKDTEDAVRELQRKTMSDEEAWYDRRKEAATKLAEFYSQIYKAKTPEELQDALSMYSEIKSLYSSLAAEVKEGDKVLVSMSKGVAAATDGLKDLGTAKEAGLKKLKELEEANRKAAEESAKSFKLQWEENKKIIDNINQTPVNPKVDFKVDQSSVSDVERVREALAKPITVKVNYVSSGGGGSSSSGSTEYFYGDSNTYEGSAAETYWKEYYGFRLGGIIRKFAEGGFNRLSGMLPGWGGGDRVKALLEDGEFIIRKEAVKKYGAALFQALNGMRVNIPNVVASAMPALPELPKTAFATGGAVSSAGDYGTLRLQAGGVELPVMVQGSGGRQMVKEFEKELRKLKLTQGR